MIDPRRFSSKTLAGKVIRLPLRLLPSGLAVPVVRGPNKGLRWVTGSSVHGCWLGTYEQDKVELLREYVQPGMVAYDVGANAGYYTLLLSRLVGPSGRVYALEPLPENLVHLRHHLSVNRLTNCRVVAAAASDRTGLAAFRAARSNAMGSIAAGDAPLHVPTVSLDDLAAWGLPRPDFVKMDVEGAEGLVLAGAQGLLREHRCVWFVALHGEEPARASLALLRGSGHRVRDLVGADVSEASTGLVDEVYAIKES